MKDTAPKVSIGMPVFNGERFIREALDSLLAQTFTNFELIISDNCSTDGTEGICQEYSQRDKRIRYIRHQSNLGAIANFRFVLDQACGDYFIWSAADDLQHPDLLTSLVSILDKHSEVVLVSPSIEYINDNGDKLWDDILASINIYEAIANPRKNRRLFFKNPTSNIFFAIYGLYRTPCVKSSENNYKGMLKYATGSEIPLLAQISLQGIIASIPETLKQYRRHSASVYYTELKDNRSPFFYLKNNSNISHILTKIVVHSHLDASEKAYLLGRISYDQIMILVRFVTRLIKYNLKRILQPILDQ